VSCVSVRELSIVRFLCLGGQNPGGLILDTILGASSRPIFRTVKFESLNDQFSSCR
jgi:hypothetical protein